jgi:hypothetical protein
MPPSAPRTANTANILGDGREAVAGGGADLRFGRTALDQAAQREVEGFVTPSGVPEARALQTLFVQDFPFNEYHDVRDEIVSLKAALCAEDVTDLIVRMLRFVHVAYVAPLSRAREHTVTAPSDVDDAFVDFYRSVLAILYSSGDVGRAASGPAPGESLSFAGSTKGAASFSESQANAHSNPLLKVRAAACTAAACGAPQARLAPMIVLLLRVALDREFIARMPSFMRLPAGTDLGVRADALLTAVVDPLNLLCQLAVVESTPHAMRVMQTKRRPARMPPLVTSPLVQFVLGEPQSASAKALQRSTIPRLQRGLAELKKHLTPMARARLLQAMALGKFGVA